MNINERDKQLSKHCKDLMLREPYYGFFLSTLNYIWEDGKNNPTAKVSKEGLSFYLKINPTFWDSRKTPHEQYCLVKHELLHILFHHLTMAKDFDDPKILNIAADLEINQYIENPPDYFLSYQTSFPELNLPPKAGTVKYYEILKEALEENKSSSLSDLYNNIPLEIRHDWEEFESLSDAEKKLLDQQLQNIMSEIAEQVKKSRGHVPGEIIQWIEQYKLMPPSVPDWKQLLRLFIGKSIKTYTKKQRRKESKRFEGNPGIKLKRLKNILVAIDTSMSISLDELDKFLNELHHLSKTGNTVTVVQCDAAIKKISQFKRNMPIEIVGGGGTSFIPVIEYYECNRTKYDCLVYFTDGYAPTPDVQFPSEVVWIISESKNKNYTLPGRIIYMTSYEK